MSVCEIACAGAETKSRVNPRGFPSIGKFLGPDSVNAQLAIHHWLVANLTAA
jgi:hypothetical protein